MNPADREQHRPEPPEHSGFLGSLLLVVLGAALAAATFWAIDHYRHRNAPPTTDPNAKLREPVPAGPLDPDETEAVELFKKLKPSVVNVDIVQRTRAGWGDDRVAERQTGAGSGFVWDDDGRMVTNYHVVADLYR